MSTELTFQTCDLSLHKSKLKKYKVRLPVSLLLKEVIEIKKKIAKKVGWGSG